MILELGGNAACIVDEDADLDRAVDRLVFGASYQSGQSCIGVQRILIHHARYEETKDRLVAATRALKAGDPKDEATFIGLLIFRPASAVSRWRVGRSVVCGDRAGQGFQERHDAGCVILGQAAAQLRVGHDLHRFLEIGDRAVVEVRPRQGDVAQHRNAKSVPVNDFSA